MGVRSTSLVLGTVVSVLPSSSSLGVSLGRVGSGWVSSGEGVINSGSSTVGAWGYSTPIAMLEPKKSATEKPMMGNRVALVPSHFLNAPGSKTPTIKIMSDAKVRAIRKFCMWGVRGSSTVVDMHKNVRFLSGQRPRGSL